MTDNVRQKFLDVHNKYREMVAKGEAEDGLGGKAPKAARMFKLRYDCGLESTAVEYAKKCNYDHSPLEERSYAGENLYSSENPKMDKMQVAERAPEVWFEELKKYGVGQENVLTEKLWARPDTQIGHYTQMIWQSTRYIGCGVQHCPSQTLAVCHYSRGGNVMGEKIYDAGEPCSMCPLFDKCATTSEKLCLTE
ncbi:SCP-like protein [Ancylostoma caninum]|uniref:SCP-like protein n=1 Tax=Ancylostoma caninum TaxID=29170 RepID=A0A368H8I8_ANCCA|nr:SCP-like protein [Ancylostoma caninum]